VLNITEEKKEVRARFVKLRNALSETVCIAKSNAIEKRVLASSEFISANVIQFYVSNGFEVQTHRLIEEAMRLGKKVVVPVLSEAKRPWVVPPTLSEISDPKRRVSSEEVDVWILPAVACDTMGHRLGRGGGYYDRLLQRCVRKILCLVFEFQIVDALPFEPTDHNVDLIITEDRTILCGVNTPPFGHPS